MIEFGSVVDAVAWEIAIRKSFLLDRPMFPRSSHRLAPHMSELRPYLPRIELGAWVDAGGCNARTMPKVGRPVELWGIGATMLQVMQAHSLLAATDEG